MFEIKGVEFPGRCQQQNYKKDSWCICVLNTGTTIHSDDFLSQTFGVGNWWGPNGFEIVAVDYRFHLDLYPGPSASLTTAVL